MGIVSMGPPEEVVCFLRDQADSKLFIETGTYFGETTAWASRHFSKVISIELSEKYFLLAQKKFRDVPNVELCFGDSRQVLRDLTSNLKEPAIFWLDAHFCDDGAGKGKSAPILEEINIIYSASLDHILLIDDARLFLSPPPASPEEYPDICTLLGTMKTMGDPYVILYDDVLVCVPQRFRKAVSEFFVVYATHRDPACGPLRTQIKRMLKGDRLPTLKQFLSNFQRRLTSKARQNKLLQSFIKKRKLREQFLRLRSSVAHKEHKRFNLEWAEQYPCFDDETTTPNFGEYFYHLAWAARKLVTLNPAVHYDISSHSYFIGILSAVIPIKYFEYRHIPVTLSGLETASGDICHLPFDDASIASLSCMHVIEHIGLGRYGDILDYDGDLKAMAELKRVVAPGGDLLLVVPVGTPARIEFNAHRIYAYDDIVSFFSPDMSLEEVSLISYNTNGYCSASKMDMKLGIQGVAYGVACFHFRKA